jgi:hypothetical protein
LRTLFGALSLPTIIGLGLAPAQVPPLLALLEFSLRKICPKAAPTFEALKVYAFRRNPCPFRSVSLKDVTKAQDVRNKLVHASDASHPPTPAECREARRVLILAVLDLLPALHAEVADAIFPSE